MDGAGMDEEGRATPDGRSGWVAPELPSAAPLATVAVGGTGRRSDSRFGSRGDRRAGRGSGSAGVVDVVETEVPAHRLGPSSGIAVARGDARRTRTQPAGARSGAATSHAHGDDPAAVLDGNPLRSLAVVGPGAVLDQSFDLLRFRFRRWVALAAVLFVPVQLVDLSIALSGSGGSGTTTSGPGTEGFSQFRLLDGAGGASGWAWLVVGLQSLALFLLGMAAGHLVAGWLDGRDDPFGTVVGAVARRVWVAPLVVVPALVAKVAATCFGGVGFFLVDALLFVAAPVAGGELAGPWATLSRSVRLTRRSYGVAFVVVIGGFCITTVLRVALGAGPLLLVSMLGLPSEWLVVIEQATSVTLLVTMPLTACIAARAHVDLRCRAEGFDLVRREEARGLR